MALAKESESFDEYSIEKRGSSVRLEKQIGQFQCSFCSEESDFYEVRRGARGNYLPKIETEAAAAVAGQIRGHALVRGPATEHEPLRKTHDGRGGRGTGAAAGSSHSSQSEIRPHQQGPGLQGEEHAQHEPLEVLVSKCYCPSPS